MTREKTSVMSRFITTQHKRFQLKFLTLLLKRNRTIFFTFFLPLHSCCSLRFAMLIEHRQRNGSLSDHVSLVYFVSLFSFCVRFVRRERDNENSDQISFSLQHLFALYYGFFRFIFGIVRSVFFFRLSLTHAFVPYIWCIVVSETTDFVSLMLLAKFISTFIKSPLRASVEQHR